MGGEGRGEGPTEVGVMKDTVGPEASHSREPASAPKWYTSRVPPSQGQVGLYGSGGSGPSVVFTSLRWGGLWGYGAYRFCCPWMSFIRFAGP